MADNSENVNPFLVGVDTAQDSDMHQDNDVIVRESVFNNNINIELEDDRHLVIDVIADPSKAVSALHIVTVLLLGNTAILLLTFVVAKRYDSSHSGRSSLPSVIRKYTKQVSFCNSIVAIINVVAVYWLSERSADDVTLRPICMRSFDRMLLVLVVFAVSVFITFVRFMAYVYAFETNHAKEALPQTQQNVFSGGSGSGVVVLGSICSLLKIGAIFFLLELSIYFELVPDSVHDFLDFTFCVDQLPADFFSRFVFLVIILCEMQVGILVSEVLFNRRLKVGLQFMHLILQSEFCATSFALNLFGLYSLLVVMWLSGNAALHCLLFTQVFVSIDTFWAFVICCSSPNQPSHSELSKM